MPNTISLTSKTFSLSPSSSTMIDIAGIFRSQAFKVAVELITVLSFFTAAAVWIVALSKV